MVGITVDVMKALPGPEDFLVRGAGFERSGTMAVAEYVKVGQQLRFMVRDRQGAQEDLNRCDDDRGGGSSVFAAFTLGHSASMLLVSRMSSTACLSASPTSPRCTGG